VISRRRCFFGGLLRMGRTRTRLSAYAPQRQGHCARRHVTLKGPVRSEDEKKVVEAKALSVIGAGHVVNELTVAPPSKNH
jgi:osmotically-inducible protein OsmY